MFDLLLGLIWTVLLVGFTCAFGFLFRAALQWLHLPDWLSVCVSFAVAIPCALTLAGTVFSVAARNPDGKHFNAVMLSVVWMTIAAAASAVLLHYVLALSPLDRTLEKFLVMAGGAGVLLALLDAKERAMKRRGELVSPEE